MDYRGRFLPALIALCVAASLQAQDTPQQTVDQVNQVTAGPQRGRVAIETVSGDMLSGTLLKRDDESLYVYVGGSVVVVPHKNIKSISNEEGERQEVKNVREHGLYKTGQRSIKNIQTLVEELGQAIVIVRTPTGMGTGWFCNKDGYLITNNHVVSGERSVTVTLFHREGNGFSKQVYKKVRIVALNADMDLALLKIEEEINVPYPQLYVGDSTQLQVGDRVFAIGNPMGLERSTSIGTISKAARNHGGRLYLQTTAPIAPGNSGGPLFNERGEVIGVVNMGYVMRDGLGFAIPSKYVKEFLNNTEAFAYDEDNPNSGTTYMEVPVTASDHSFGFYTSDFIKVGHGVTCLTLADLTGDKVSEIAFVNNHKAEIGYARRRRPGEEQEQLQDYEDINQLRDSRYFKLETIPVNSRVSAIAVADLNDDERPDMIFAGDLEGLAVCEQKADGTFKRPRKIDKLDKPVRSDGLKVVDLNADGQKDIFVLGADEFTVFWSGSDRKSFDLGDYGAAIKEYELADFNDDGRLDVIFLTGGQHYATYVRLQNEAGKFLEDLPIQGSITGEVVPYRQGGQRSYLTLDRGLNRVRSIRLSGEQADAGMPVSLRTLPVGQSSGVSGTINIAKLDPNGPDVLLAVDRKQNEFLIYSYAGGELNVTRSPSPTEVEQALLYTDSKGRSAVISYSPKDSLFGVSRVDDAAIDYPRPINTENEVQLITANKIRSGGKEQTHLFWLEKDRSKYSLMTVPMDAVVEMAHNGAEGSVDLPAEIVMFAGSRGDSDTLSRRPGGFAFPDLNRDGNSDLIVYSSYSGKESLYLGESHKRFKAIVEEQKVLDEKKNQPLLSTDIDGDGTDEVILVKSGFVRVLNVDDKGTLYVERQFNWPLGELEYLQLYRVTKDGPQFIAMSRDQAQIVRLNLDENSFERVDRMDMTGIAAGRLEIGDLDGDDQLDIVGIGGNAIHVFLHRDQYYAHEAQPVFTAPLDYFSYWNLFTADFDDDDSDEVMLFDSRKAMLEIHRAGDDGDLSLLLRHRLFERTIFERRDRGDGAQAPKELGVADVDGDGRADFVCILQDRISIYLQSRKGETQ